MSLLRRASPLLAPLAWLTTGCIATAPLDGKLCNDEHPCVDGYACVDGACRTGGAADAGVLVDGGQWHDAGDADDAGGPLGDGGRPDAGPLDGGASADAGAPGWDGGDQSDDGGTQNEDGGTQSDDGGGTQSDDGGDQNDDGGTQSDGGGDPSDGGPGDAGPRADAGTPALSFSYVPPWGSLDDLEGDAAGVEPASHRVVVYIYVSGGWWIKPSTALPLTPLDPDGSFRCDITTGGADANATQIVAYLVPSSESPPLLEGAPSLPASLEANALARTSAARAEVLRTLSCAGATWKVKSSGAPVGPGPNFFSDETDSVYCGDSNDDDLHLWIRDRGGGRWESAEVYTDEVYGRGTFYWKVISPRHFDLLDENVVFALFTYDADAPAEDYRELDVEYSRWGNAGADPGQYVVQPYAVAGNLERFDFTLEGSFTSHFIEWQPGSVVFQTRGGHYTPAELGGAPAPIHMWTYSGPDVPSNGQVSARINLWLFQGQPPGDGQEVEVIVREFGFVP